MPPLSSTAPDQAFAGPGKAQLQTFNSHGEVMQAMYSPDTHTRINVQLPYSVPGCQEPYEAWNAGYESFPEDAFLPTVPVWVTNDARLACYADPAGEASKRFNRGQIISHASRITTAVKLRQRFEVEAVDAVRARRPYGRNNTPELTLTNLLRDGGKGFAELAEALCYPAVEGDKMIPDDRFVVVPNREWERLMGMSAANGLSMSRFRRAYIEVMLISRHMALTRVVERVLAELALPGDVTARPPAWTPSDNPRCALCSRDITGKPLQCSACLKIGRKVYYCDSTHHVQHWKTGHKASCGTPDAEIAIPSSFPTHASARHPSLTSLSNLLKKNVNGFWGFQLQGRSVGLVFPPGFDSFSAQDKVDALAEFRRIAFRACDVGAVDEVSSGAMALLLEAFNSDLANFVFEEELERMAAMYKLEAGAAGARAMRRRMGTARDAIESGGFPFTKRIIDYFLPLALETKFDQGRLDLIVRFRRSLVFNSQTLWVVRLHGRDQGAGIASSFYPYNENAAALREYRQVAFRVLDSPDELSTGLLVNTIRTLTQDVGLHGYFDLDYAMERLARIVGLPSGREGRRELEKRAREALVSQRAKREFPLLLRYLESEVPRTIAAGYGIFVDDEAAKKEDDLQHTLATLNFD